MEVRSLVTFLLLTLVALPRTLAQISVCARGGCVTGVEETGNLKSYEAFLGIPFAQPPTGRYRFENPRPFRYWGNKWNGTYSRSECVQLNMFRSTTAISGDEDCLYLNVYRPKCQNCTGLPVIAYLHGGGFYFGSANDAGPEYFMDSGNVILVTIQYRLGIFGFLSSGDESCTGNFGLKDQRMALRWIQRNIEGFGGNPKSVTLMGHSAGASSVHLHMMSPRSNELFHRGVLLSGTGLADWAIEVNPLKVFWKQLEYSGVPRSDAKTTLIGVRKLKAIGAYRLLEDSLKFSSTVDVLTVFKPSIEQQRLGSFLTDNPKLIWKEGKFKQKPMLFSFVPNEGGPFLKYLKSEEDISKLNGNLNEFIAMGLELKADNVPKVLDYYLGGRSQITSNDVETILKIVGDRYFYHPLQTTISQYISHADKITNPVFLIKFAYQGPFSFSQVYTGSDRDFGVVHGDDLAFYFTRKNIFPNYPAESLDAKMVHIMTQNILNFALTDQVQKWQSLSPCTHNTSSICDYQVFEKHTESETDQIVVGVSNEFDIDMVKFWDEIIDNNFQ